MRHEGFAKELDRILENGDSVHAPDMLPQQRQPHPPLYRNAQRDSRWLGRAIAVAIVALILIYFTYASRPKRSDPPPVEHLADAVSAILAHHAAMMLLGMLLNGVTDVAESNALTNHFDTDFHALVGEA